MTIPEPSGCTGLHPEGYRRCDTGQLGPSIAVTVNTEQGPCGLLDLAMWQDPFPTSDRTHSDEVHMAVQLLDGETYAYDVVGMEALAIDLLEAAGKVGRWRGAWPSKSAAASGEPPAPAVRPDG